MAVHMAVHMAPTWDIRLPAFTLGIICLTVIPIIAQQPPEPLSSETEEAATEDPPSTTEVASSDTDARQPVPIPVADIPGRLAEVTANVRRVETLVEPQQAVEVIGAALSDQAQLIVQLRTTLNRLKPNSATVERIEDQRVGWTELQQTLAGRMTVLQTRWTELQSERTELRETQSLWTLTRANAVGEDAQPEVLQRIDAALSSLAQAEASVQLRSDTLATMLDRVSRADEVVQESFDRLAALEETSRRRVLTRDAEPFWRGLAVPDVQLFLTDVQLEREYWYTTLREFVEERQGRFALLGGIFVVMLIGAATLRRWSFTWPEDDALTAARHVASRPISTALALTLACTGLVIRRAVGPLSDVVAVLALVPVFRLGVGLAQPHIRRLMYGVTTVLVLLLLTTFTPDGSFLRRLLMLVVTAAGVAGAVWLIRRWRQTDIVSQSRTAQIGLVGLQLATVLLGVALLANLLGWFALSQLLLQATVISAYSAVAWRIVSLTLTALVPVAPYSVVGRALPSIVRYEATFNKRAAVVIATVGRPVGPHVDAFCAHQFPSLRPALGTGRSGHGLHDQRRWAGAVSRPSRAGADDPECHAPRGRPGEVRADGRGSATSPTSTGREPHRCRHCELHSGPHRDPAGGLGRRPDGDPVDGCVRRHGGRDRVRSPVGGQQLRLGSHSDVRATDQGGRSD